MELPSPQPSPGPSPSPSRQPSPSPPPRPSPAPAPIVFNTSRRVRGGRRGGATYGPEYARGRPYSRPGRRQRYASREASLHGDSSSDVEEDAFEFTLVDSNNADSGSESDAGGPLLTQDLRNAGESKQAAAAHPEADIYNVVESLYTGEGIVGGVQQAKLTVVRDRRPDQSTFYRWIHRTDESMVLRRFETLTLELPELDDFERRAITKLFERVRQKFERQMPLSASSKAMEMEPDMIQEPVSSKLKSSNKKETPRHVTWICVPFFLLRGYQGLDGYKSWEHPMRTLLQYRFASAQKTRDLQQAVCNLPGTPKDHCFRVAQLWCLILDDSFVATYAPIPQPSIASDVIKLSDPLKASLPGERPKRLLVSFGSSVLWSFNVADCPTWFALMRNFVEFWPRRTQLFYGKKEVTTALYPKILRRARQFGAVQMKLSVSSSRLHVERIGPSLHQRSGGSDESAEPLETQPTVPGEAGDGHQHKSAHLSPTARSSESCEYFVLVCANIGAGKEYSRLSSEEHSSLSKGLRRMDHFLSQGTPLKERVSYRHCPSAKYIKVLSELQQEESKLLTIPNDGENAEQGRAMFSAQKDLFTVARALYGIFAPTELDRPVIAKYWGALQTILQSYRVEPAEDDTAGGRYQTFGRKDVIRQTVWSLTAGLKHIAEEAMCVKVLFSSMSFGSSEEVKVPDEFVKAWLHIMVGVVLSSSVDGSGDWAHHTELAFELVRKGRAVLSSDLLRTSLTDHVVATPPAVAALIVLRFLRDVTPGDRSILNSYAEYMRILESRIDEKPLKQDHQINLARVQEEMGSIKDILAHQLKVCQLMTAALASGTMKYERMHEQAILGEMPPGMHYHGTRAAAQRPVYWTHEGKVRYGARRSRSLEYNNIEMDYDALPPGERKILPTDARGHQSIISQDCERLAISNMQGFEKLGMHADELQRMVSRKVKSNRERQDNAMYAFTIVTIVFLPLSTVAGIFGMNTSDIRDMDQPQWLFWAVAVPLWFIVIVLCLIWSGEWERFRESKDAKSRASSNPAGVAKVSEGARPVPIVAERTSRTPRRR